MFDVKIEVVGLDTLATDWNAVMEALVGSMAETSVKVARRGLEELQRHIPKASGKLAESGMVKLGKQTRDFSYAEIRFTKQYASYSDEGAPRHTIRPRLGHGQEGPLRNGQTRRRKNTGPQREALRFFVGGEERFAFSVDHPGQKAQHWSDKADGTIAELLAHEIALAFDRAAQRLGTRVAV